MIWFDGEEACDLAILHSDQAGMLSDERPYLTGPAGAEAERVNGHDGRDVFRLRRA